MDLSERLVLAEVKELKGRRVFVRVDFNVPMEDGKITSDQRMVAALPTLKHLIQAGARVIVASHLGRPDGRVQKKYSLHVVAIHLAELLEQPVGWVEDCVGAEVEAKVSALRDGDVLMLENVRFHLGEEGKGKDKDGKTVKATKEEIAEFRAQLTKLADVYVNDAFGACHRAHSTMVGIDVPQKAAGFLVSKELEYFSKALEKPEKPYVAILGGAKVGDKIKLIENLLDQPALTHLIIGGGMAYTFKAGCEGMKIGGSIVQNDFLEKVKDLVAKAKDKNVELMLPSDFVAADKFSNDAKLEIVSDKQGIEDGWQGLDIGPETRDRFAKVVLAAKTIVWNGPMGVFEFENLSEGTRAMMDAVVAATEKGAVSVIGGGDTATCCLKWGTSEKVSHVSTGGGASLELLEGKLLPGVTALSKKQ